MISPNVKTVINITPVYSIPSPATARDVQDTLSQILGKLRTEGETMYDDSVMVFSSDETIEFRVRGIQKVLPGLLENLEITADGKLV